MDIFWGSSQNWPIFRGHFYAFRVFSYDQGMEWGYFWGLLKYFWGVKGRCWARSLCMKKKWECPLGSNNVELYWCVLHRSLAVEGNILIKVKSDCVWKISICVGSLFWEWFLVSSWSTSPPPPPPPPPCCSIVSKLEIISILILLGKKKLFAFLCLVAVCDQYPRGAVGWTAICGILAFPFNLSYIFARPVGLIHFHFVFVAGLCVSGLWVFWCFSK